MNQSSSKKSVFHRSNVARRMHSRHCLGTAGANTYDSTGRRPDDRRHDVEAGPVAAAVAHIAIARCYGGMEGGRVVCAIVMCAPSTRRHPACVTRATLVGLFTPPVWIFPSLPRTMSPPLPARGVVKSVETRSAPSPLLESGK